MGGDLVRRFRHVSSSGDDHWTEEWIGSTIETGNRDPAGRSQGLSKVMVEGGRIVDLRDLVEAHPEQMLGSPFVERYGATLGFVVKIISLGEIGPVHAHPDESFARSRLDLQHGQAEAWILLEGPEGHRGDIEAGVGFRMGAGREALHRALKRRSGEEMRRSLNPVRVSAGQTWLIRPGTPHYIGAGALFIEIQQPSDISIVPEFWTIGATESEGALGLGWEEAIEVFDEEQPRQSQAATVASQQSRPIRRDAASLEEALFEEPQAVPFDARRLRVEGGMEVEAGRLAVNVISGGRGYVEGDWGRTPIKAGDALVTPAGLPHSFVSLEVPLTVHRCMGPTAEHSAGSPATSTPAAIASVPPRDGKR